MRARLETLGVDGRARAHVPLCRALPAALLPAGRGRADPAVEGADAPPDRELAAGAVQVPAGRRPRDRDRVGQEQADLGTSATRTRSTGTAADPRGPDGGRVRAVRAAEARAGPDGLRGPARARDARCSTTSTRRRVPRRATSRSRSTSTRTSTCSSRRCSTAGSAAATISASSATTTSRSTGSPARRRSYLLGVPRRFPHAAVIRLEENYRSTPQVLELANRLVPKLGGAEKMLRAVRPDGPEPERAPVRDAGGGGARSRRARSARPGAARGDRLLCRTHARLADFEEVLHEAGIPSQGAAFLERDAARRLLRRARPVGAGAPRSARLALEAAGRRSRRTRSASGSRRGRTTSRGSSGWPRRSAAPAPSSSPSSSGASARAARRARRQSPDLPPGQGPRVRGSSSCRGSRRRSCPRSRRVGRRRSPRSGGCSTSG